MCIRDSPDRLRSLFSLGFAVDEQLADRLAHHKRSGEPPEVSLPERARRQSGARRWPSEQGREPLHLHLIRARGRSRLHRGAGCQRRAGSAGDRWSARPIFSANARACA